MIAVRVLETLGTVLLLISTILSFVKQCSSKDRSALFKISGGLALIAAVVTVIGVAIFGAMKESQTGRSGPTPNYKFLAGFYISIVAGCLALIAGLMFLLDKTLGKCRPEM